MAYKAVPQKLNVFKSKMDKISSIVVYLFINLFLFYEKGAVEQTTFTNILHILMFLVLFWVFLETFFKSFHIITIYNDKFILKKIKLTESYGYEEVEKIKIKKLFFFGHTFDIVLKGNRKINFLFYTYENRLLIKELFKQAPFLFNTQEYNSYYGQLRLTDYRIRKENIKTFLRKDVFLHFVPIIILFISIFFSSFYLAVFSTVNLDLPAIFFLISYYHIILMILTVLLFLLFFAYEIYQIKKADKFITQNFHKLNYRDLRSFFPSLKSRMIVPLLSLLLIFAFHFFHFDSRAPIPKAQSTIVDLNSLKKGSYVDFRYNCSDCQYPIKSRNIVFYYDEKFKMHVGVASAPESVALRSNNRAIASSVKTNSNYVMLIIDKDNKIISVNKKMIVGTVFTRHR